MCGGGLRSISLLPLVTRCLETIDVCIWYMFFYMSVVVNVWGNVCCVAAVIVHSGFLSWSVEVCCVFVQWLLFALGLGLSQSMFPSRNS